MTALAMTLTLLCFVAPATEPTPLVADDDVAPTARQLLDLAARFQRGDTPRPTPRSFHGRFYATVRNPQDGSSANLFLERWYMREPERMVTHRRDTLVESDSTQGFDGRRTWVRDNVSGRVDLFDVRPDVFETDLEDVAHQLRLTRVLVDMALLDALIPRLRDAERLDGTRPVVDQDGARHEVATVRARLDDELFGPDPDGPPVLPGDPAPQLEVELDIDVKTGALWGLRLRTVERTTPRALEVSIGLYLPNRAGLRVPAYLEVTEDGEKAPSLKLGVAAEDVGTPDAPRDVAVFDLDVPFDPQVFAVPKPDDP